MKMLQVFVAVVTASFLAGCCCVQRDCQEGCGLLSVRRCGTNPCSCGDCKCTSNECGSCRLGGIFSQRCGSGCRTQSCGDGTASCNDGCQSCSLFGGRIRGAMQSGANGNLLGGMRGCGQCADGSCGTCGQNSVLDRGGLLLGGRPVMNDRFAARDGRFASSGCAQAGDCDGCAGNGIALVGGVGNGIGNGVIGCGRGGCGTGGRLCDDCRRRHHLGAGVHGRLHPYGGYIPHTPEAQLYGQGPMTPTYAYPYYTTRGPRDFLMDNPPSIGQ